MLHKHKNKDGIVFGYPHPMKEKHKQPITQCAHFRTLAEDKVISWLKAEEEINLILAKVKKEVRIIQRCPECGIGKPGVDALCNRCYKEYLGTKVGSRSEDQ